MLVKRFLSDPNIVHKGRAIDIGFGSGKDALALTQAGYSVEAIDKNKEAVEGFLETAKKSNISVSEKDVRDFVPDKNTYSVIVASSVLFFIEDKNRVLALLEQFIDALTGDGHLLFSLLGPNDAWKGRKGISFFRYDEVMDFLSSKGLDIYFRSTEEGYGPMMSGEIKYWHLHRFIVRKK